MWATHFSKLFLALSLLLVMATAHPLQLVAPNENHDMLVINETNLAILESWHEQVIVIVVCGPLHSGKSFLSNQLRNLETSGFKLGPTTKPETRGLWMWSEPLRLNGKQIVFLDTEGLFSSNVTEVYDGKIFAISALMSSVLVYNTVKFVDQSSIEYMEMLIRRAQLFELKSRVDEDLEMAPALNLGRFGHLVWVVQDFVQEMSEGESADDWLLGLLSTTGRTENTKSISPIMSLFDAIHCRTLFIPDVNPKSLARLDSVAQTDLLPEYAKDIASLRQLVIDLALDPSSLAKTSTGAMAAQFLRTLVGAANRDMFPEMPSIWSGFLVQQITRAKEDALNFFERTMTTTTADEILATADLKKQLQIQQERAQFLFTNLTLGISLSVVELNSFQQNVEKSAATFIQNAAAKLRTHVEFEFGKLKQEFKFALNQILLPYRPDDLKARLKSLPDPFVKTAKTTMAKLVHDDVYISAFNSFWSFVEAEKVKLEQKNTEISADVISAAASNALDVGVKFLVKYSGVILDFKTADVTLKECVQVVQDKFASLTTNAPQDYPQLVNQALHSMKTTTDNMIFQFRQSNAALVTQHVRSMAKTLLLDVSNTFDAESLPQTMKHLEHRSTQIIADFEQRFMAQIAKYVGIAGVEEERLRFLNQCNEERVELFRRNHVKYDHLIANNLPSMQPMLQRQVNEFWTSTSAANHVREVISSKLKEQNHVKDPQMVEELVDRYMSKLSLPPNIWQVFIGFMKLFCIAIAIFGVIMAFISGFRLAFSLFVFCICVGLLFALGVCLFIVLFVNSFF